MEDFDQISEQLYLSKDRTLLLTQLSSNRWKIELYRDDVDHIEFLDITQGQTEGDLEFIKQQIKCYYDKRKNSRTNL